ncbi:MAG: hypothetical protein KW806_01685 [Candidatus Yanofskybacteria bacterium]|nr:hypothetical protein [Candidatus Yanofskybacteria bacterium]
MRPLVKNNLRQFRRPDWGVSAMDRDELELAYRRVMDEVVALERRQNQEYCHIDLPEFFQKVLGSDNSNSVVDPPCKFLRGCIEFRSELGGSHKLSLWEAIKLAWRAWRTFR